MPWLPVRLPERPSWLTVGDGSTGGLPRVVLVTGASSGIGRACALLAASHGDHVALLARSGDTLDELAADCEREGAASAQVVAADMQKDAEVGRAVHEVRTEHGRLDAVLHSAGVVTYGRTEDVQPEDFEAVVATNLLGTVNLARHVIPVFREQGRGTLVIVGSLLGHIAVPEMTPYVVSKWAVRALARQLAMENADLPALHVAHVAPGSVDTPIYAKALDSDGADHAPPPPSISPERAARAIYRQVTHPRGESQTAWANYALIGAFHGAPWLWDRLAGPLFDLVSRRDGGSGDGGADDR